IFTMIGTAHDEGFQDRHQKILEKSKLFEHAQKIIYCHDHGEVRDVLYRKYNKRELISWGRNEKCTVQLKDIKRKANAVELLLSYDGRRIAFSLPFTNEASI